MYFYIQYHRKDSYITEAPRPYVETRINLKIGKVRQVSIFLLDPIDSTFRKTQLHPARDA